jgi:restriction system protein
MAIPDYQTLMLPALRCLADGRIRVVRDVVEELADKFGLTDADRAQLLPSGGTLTFASRVGWAKTYLKKAGLLTQPKRGIVQISPKGRELLAAPPDVLNTKFLDKFESFQTFRNAGRTPPMFSCGQPSLTRCWTELKPVHLHSSSSWSFNC